MKKAILAIVAMLMLPLSLLAQEERPLMPVDWPQLKTAALRNPQRIRWLVAKMVAQQPDSMPTRAGCIEAFYGQSLLTCDVEEMAHVTMTQLFKDGKYEECLAQARKVLSVNPLHLDALITGAEVLGIMAADSTRWADVTDADAEPYIRLAASILNTIAATGDGTAEHPFYVTKISDEYNFMRYYLDLWDYTRQTATECCDVITLEKGSEYYTRPDICFNVERVYELEKRLLQTIPVPRK